MTARDVYQEPSEVLSIGATATAQGLTFVFLNLNNEKTLVIKTPIGVEDAKGTWDLYMEGEDDVILQIDDERWSVIEYHSSPVAAALKSGDKTLKLYFTKGGATPLYKQG